MQGIVGEKVGMTAVYGEDGSQIPVTVVRTTKNIVVDKRTQERDGYSAVVMGFGERTTKRVRKPLLGYFEKQGLVEERDGQRFVKRHLREFRVSAEVLEGLTVGDAVTAESIFTPEDTVDVVGTSKGRGFAGVMVRYNFKGGKATHGVHEYYRHGGSIGMCAWPARVFKNKKMPGQHGNRRRTIQNLRVVDILADEGLVLIRGGIPGPNGGIVMIQKSVKKNR
jgi:large subunit ribosomal protein L3